MKSQHKNVDKHDDLVAWHNQKIQHFYKLSIFQVFRIIIFKMVTLIQINIARYLNLLTYKQPPIHPKSLAWIASLSRASQAATS